MRGAVHRIVPLALLLAGGCAVRPPSAKGPDLGALVPADGPVWALEMAAAMDPSVPPCDDFYRYACGGWLGQARIPAGHDSWDRGHSAASMAAAESLLAVFRAPPRPSDSAEVAAARRFLASCESAGRVDDRIALGPLLDRIDEVKDEASLMRVTGYLHGIGVRVLFTPIVLPVGGRLTYVLAPGGVSFPPGVYLSTDPTFEPFQVRYRNYIARLLEPVPDASGSPDLVAERVFAFETGLAEFLAQPPEATAVAAPRPITRQELAALSPTLPWDEYFGELGLPAEVPVAILAPEAIRHLEDRVNREEPEHWRRYLRWWAMVSLAPWLSEDSARHAMRVPFREVFSLSTAPPPRQERCIAEVEVSMPLAIVDVSDLQADSDPVIAGLELARGVGEGLSRRVADSPWMDVATRNEAQRKLENAAWAVGVPAVAPRPPAEPPAAQRGDSPEGFVELMLDARRRTTRWAFRQLADAGDGAVTFTRRTSPPLALYQPAANLTEVSPTLLGAPFLVLDRPAAANFGAYGAVVGHELSHAIGSGGRHLDAQGVARDWYSPASAAAWSSTAACLAETYSTFEIAPAGHFSPAPLRLDGERTLEENTADLGGLAAAFDAWTAWADERGPGHPSLAGISDAQLFFLAYAQMWCERMNAGAQIATAWFGEHATGRIRVNATLAQFSPFADAFACAPHAPMVAARPCRAFAPPPPRPQPPAAAPAEG